MHKFYSLPEIVFFSVSNVCMCVQCEKDHAREHVAVAVVRYRRFFGTVSRNNMYTSHEFFMFFFGFYSIKVWLSATQESIRDKDEKNKTTKNRAV